MAIEGSISTVCKRVLAFTKSWNAIRPFNIVMIHISIECEKLLVEARPEEELRAPKTVRIVSGANESLTLRHTVIGI